MEVKLKDFIEPGKIVSFVNFSGSFSKLKNNSKISYILDEPLQQNISVKKYFEKKFPLLSHEKIMNAFKMALLDASLMSFNVSKLSRTEIKKLRLVEALLQNSETFLFVHFEQGFYAKSRSYYQKLFLKLTTYGKCIIVVTKDVSFLMGMVSSFVLFKENSYEWISDFYDDSVYRYVDMPMVISYVKYLRERGIKMESYIEPKEVLKAIYRSVASGERL